LFGSEPVRLTYNEGADLSPAWLPDGSAIVYTAEQRDRRDRDWCLVMLPPRGGRIVRTVCDNRPLAAESTNTFLSAAVAPDGRLAYQRSTGRRGEQGATAERARGRDLVVATLGDPLAAGVLTRIPYTLPGEPAHGGVSHLRWLAPGVLVFRGDYYGLVCFVNVPACPQVLVRSGLGLVMARLGDSTVLEPVPGTAEASSVAAGASGDELYYTRNGDSRVYRLALSTGVATVVHDFGAVARDLQVSGARLVAVVGGTVSYSYAFTAGRNLQVDSGGEIHVVDLVSGAATVVSGVGSLYRNPALSPDGRRLVAESWTGGAADLYLFEVP
jgi:hypothetical protein